MKKLKQIIKDNLVNIHLYQSPFQHESRILRITKTLAEKKYFDKIFIVATYLEGLDEIERIDDTRTVYRVKTFIPSSSSSILRYLFLLEWSLRIIIKFHKQNVVVINPHSVPVLPLASFFKRFYNSQIVYDTHEIETEQYVGTSIRKYISKFLEKSFIKNIDFLFATSDGYAKWYQEKYDLKQIAVVKNYSREKDNQNLDNEKVLRKYCKIIEDDILFIYQGIIAKGRGIEMLLEVFTRIKSNKHIVFMGFGPNTDLVKEYSNTYKNIHYHPAVSPDEVYKYVQSCDVGLCIIENIFLSHYYTLPNKMLECLNVGVPVIVSNFPDMRKSIEEYDCGWATEVNMKSIENLISEINTEQIKGKKKGAVEWAKHNTWESQEKIMFKIYDKLLLDKLN